MVKERNELVRLKARLLEVPNGEEFYEGLLASFEGTDDPKLCAVLRGLAHVYMMAGRNFPERAMENALDGKLAEANGLIKASRMVEKLWKSTWTEYLDSLTNQTATPDNRADIRGACGYEWKR